MVSSPGETPYNYFTRLADAFLQGRLYLNTSPKWLNELIPANGAKYYVPYAPMPALLSIPFVAIFGSTFPQHYIAILISVSALCCIYLTARKLTGSILKATWLYLLFGFGTIVWFMASTGSSWYFGQLSSFLFLSLAIYESIYKKRGYVVGIFLGASYLARIHTILALPALLVLALPNKNWKQYLLKVFIGLLPFLLFNAIYNYARFGVIWDAGYTMIPGVLEEPWYQEGIFNISYIPRHLRLMFIGLPTFSGEWPFAYPGWGGLAIWFTTPAFLLIIKSKINKLSIAAVVGILLILIPIVMHGTTGFAQFGYRFAVDFYPFLALLVAQALTQQKLKWYFWALLVLSILVNIWGVVYINKLGFVVP